MLIPLSTKKEIGVTLPALGAGGGGDRGVRGGGGEGGGGGGGGRYMLGIGAHVGRPRVSSEHPSYIRDSTSDSPRTFERT